MNDVEKVIAVMDVVSSGTTITTATKIVGISLRLFYKIVNADAQLLDMYARSRSMRSDIAVDECQDIADDESIPTDRAKLRIQTRQWTASKDNPSKYGDRVNLTIDTTINIAQALADANSRVTSTTSEATHVVSELVHRPKSDD